MGSVNDPINDPLYIFAVKWGAWILIFTNFVTISLLVTLEMVKFIQGIVISKDKETTSFLNNTITPAVV